MTIEILEEKGFSVDEDGFKKAMENQRQTARDARETTITWEKMLRFISPLMLLSKVNLSAMIV